MTGALTGALRRVLIVGANGAHNPLAPFGGFRPSGHGREYGKFGLEEFLSPQSLQF